jgi:hypothetical protein
MATLQYLKQKTLVLLHPFTIQWAERAVNAYSMGQSFKMSHERQSECESETT